MKRILFVNSSLTSGGSERVMSLIANEFSKRDYKVDMVLLYNYGYDTYDVNDKINVIRFNCESKIKPIKKIRQVKELRKVLKANKYDAIISFMQSVNIVTLIANIGLKNKVIVSERCNPKVRKSFIKNFLSNILYKKAYKIVFQTEEVKKYFKKDIQNKAVVIPNPVNNSLPEPYKGVREKRIVGIGRLTEQKNFKLLITGFSKFSKKHSDYILEIYGEGPLLNELQEYSNKLDLGNRVIFKGYTKDVLNCIQKAGIYVSTSNYEGISNSMIESLAMGIPTICTDCPVGGATMMIKDNENGILIPVGGESELIEALEKVASDSNFAKKISENSVKIRKEYSLKNIVNIWEKNI